MLAGFDIPVDMITPCTGTDMPVVECNTAGRGMEAAGAFSMIACVPDGITDPLVPRSVATAGIEDGGGMVFN